MGNNPTQPCNEDNLEEPVDLTGDGADYDAEETNAKEAPAA